MHPNPNYSAFLCAAHWPFATFFLVLVLQPTIETCARSHYIQYHPLLRLTPTPLSFLLFDGRVLVRMRYHNNHLYPCHFQALHRTRFRRRTQRAESELATHPVRSGSVVR